MEARPVDESLGIILNRCSDAPHVISDAGLKLVRLDEDVQAAHSETNEPQAESMEDHTSLAAAGRAGDPHWTAYLKAMQYHRSLVKSTARHIYQRDYRAHFEGVTPLAPA